MALTKQITHLKATYANAYAKIIDQGSTSETGSDEQGKLYSANPYVTVFADNTKDTALCGQTYNLTNLRESDLTFAGLYDKLKDKEFADWSDC